MEVVWHGSRPAGKMLRIITLVTNSNPVYTLNSLDGPVAVAPLDASFKHARTSWVRVARRQRGQGRV
jgi:hypothetical protein